jgi:hypothetical protein
MRSTAASGRLEQFHLEPEPDVGRAVQRPDAAKPLFDKRTEPAGAAPTEVSFGPFRLLRMQFLLLEGNKPLPLGSRALEILTALLERHGELVSKQDLMARVWSSVFVEPANFTVHMSAPRSAALRAARTARSSTSPMSQSARTRTSRPFEIPFLAAPTVIETSPSQRTAASNPTSLEVTIRRPSTVASPYLVNDHERPRPDRASHGSSVTSPAT